MFLREKGSKPVFFCVILCTMGIILFYNPETGIHLGGSLLAIASGVTYAAYIMLLSVFKSNEITWVKLSFYMSAVSSVILFIVCIVSRQLTFPITFTGWSISTGHTIHRRAEGSDPKHTGTHYQCVDRRTYFSRNYQYPDISGYGSGNSFRYIDCRF